MKFPEFNRVVNPNDEKCYVAFTNKSSPTAMSFKDITELSKTDPTLEVGWIMPKGFYVIETECMNILPAIVNRNEEVMVVSDGKKLQIYCKGPFDRTTNNNLLACGLDANTIAHNNKGGVSIILPFKNAKVCTAPSVLKLNIVHSNGINTAPSWLLPLRKISNDKPDGIDLPIQNNEQTILLNQLKRIKHLNRLIQQEVMEVLNNEFCATPLTKDELNNLLSISEEQLLSQFFEKDKFLHNKLGDYIIETCNIKRDSVSKELFYFDDKNHIYSNDTDFITGYITKLCPSLKAYQIEETVKYIQRYLYEDSVVFNSDPFKVVFKNGILDVYTMQLEPMTPDHLESIRINCNYNPNAHSTTVDEFFDTATNGDKLIEQLLYEAIGYSMLKTNELQKAFILVGSGRNGKSTYLDLIKAVLGRENTTTVSFKDLANNFRAAMLEGKLASLAGDISSQPITDSDLVKSITAGEDITIEQKYKQAQSKALFSTLFFACNKLPRTPDTSEGFYRRWCIIPFVANLSKITRVEGMMFKKALLEQDSLDYVAYKAINAIYNVLTTTNEFSEPQAVTDILQQYKVDNSTVLSWFRDVYKEDVTKLKGLKSGAAYVSYCKWCEEAGRSRSSLTTLKNSIKSDLGVDLSD